MYTLKVIDKTREYLDYLEEHIKNVQKSWELMKDRCKDMRFIYDDFFFHMLNNDINLHDLSKLSEDEFIQYRKSFYPVEGEEKYDMTGAWNHHKENNLHHWENWANLSYFVLHPDEWEIHCAHMIVDWMAMGLKFGDTAREYYEKNKERIELPSYAIPFMYEIFDRIDNV